MYSKLKLVKPRLRSSLKNETLEACLLMCSEKDIVDSISVEEIITFLTKDSSVYSRMLLSLVVDWLVGVILSLCVTITLLRGRSGFTLLILVVCEITLKSINQSFYFHTKYSQCRVSMQ